MLPPLRDMMLVGLGGFLGANTRYILGTWAAVMAERLLRAPDWPWGTLFVNLTGSFLLAIFGAWLAHQARWASDLRLIIATGFFGAYTTFSTFANESMSIWNQGHIISASAYVLLTNLLCLVAVLLGLALANRFW